MNLKLMGIVATAAVVAISGCASRDAASGASGAVPQSSQAYPTGSTATPSGHSPGQGAGIQGSATADFHTLDANRDGQVSRQEWDGAMRRR